MYSKGALKVELSIVAQRCGAMTAYQLSWNEWDEATHAYPNDAECRAVVVYLLKERLPRAQVIFDEPYELVVKGPAGICTWTPIDDEVAEAIHQATGAGTVLVAEGSTPWDDLIPQDNSANFDNIF